MIDKLELFPYYLHLLYPWSAWAFFALVFFLLMHVIGFYMKSSSIQKNEKALKRMVRLRWLFFTLFAASLCFLSLPLCSWLEKSTGFNPYGYSKGDMLSFFGVLLGIGVTCVTYAYDQNIKRKEHARSIHPNLIVKTDLTSYALVVTIKNIGMAPAYSIRYERTRTIPCVLPDDEYSINIRYTGQDKEWGPCPSDNRIFTILDSSRLDGVVLNPVTMLPSSISLQYLDSERNIIDETFLPAAPDSNTYIPNY